MAQVTINLNGRAYRIACDDGQEDRIRLLGEVVDRRLEELTASVGNVGDLRLLVMTAIILADEMVDLAGQIDDLQQALVSSSERDQALLSQQSASLLPEQGPESKTPAQLGEDEPLTLSETDRLTPQGDVAETASIGPNAETGVEELVNLFAQRLNSLSDRIEHIAHQLEEP